MPPISPVLHHRRLLLIFYMFAVQACVSESEEAVKDPDGSFADASGGGATGGAGAAGHSGGLGGSTHGRIADNRCVDDNLPYACGKAGLDPRSICWSCPDARSGSSGLVERRSLYVFPSGEDCVVGGDGVVLAAAVSTDTKRYCSQTSYSRETVVGLDQVAPIATCTETYACVARATRPACAPAATCSPDGAWTFDLRPDLPVRLEIANVDGVHSGVLSFSTGVQECRLPAFAYQGGPCTWDIKLSLDNCESSPFKSAFLLLTPCEGGAARMTGLVSNCNLSGSSRDCVSGTPVSVLARPVI